MTKSDLDQVHDHAPSDTNESAGKSSEIMREAAEGEQKTVKHVTLDVPSTAPTDRETAEGPHLSTDFADTDIPNGSVDPRISVTDIKGNINDIADKADDEDGSFSDVLTEETEGVN
jgi:hypothetical protein